VVCGFREKGKGGFLQKRKGNRKRIRAFLTMPIRLENKHRYPSDWKEIVQRIKKRAGNKCEWSSSINKK